MIVFWIMTGLAAALASLLVLTGARRGADPASGAETQAGSREIEELDRLKARGLLDEAAYAGARAEAGLDEVGDAQADRVLAEAEGRHGAFELDGAMVDEVVLAQARAVLRRAEAAGAAAG